MNTGRLRWVGLIAAVLAVVGALWVLKGGPRARSSKAASGEASSDREGAPMKGPAGVGTREITVAGDGVVEGHVVDEDGLAVGEGQLVLWCLAADGSVARIRDGVLVLDEEGHFRGPACRGQVCPELRHASRIPAAPWVLRPGTRATLEVRALPRLWGTVVSPEGELVTGAQITITRPSDDDDPSVALPVMSSRTSTDAEGIFSLALIERPPCDPCQDARGACPDEALPVLDRVLVTARAQGWAPGSREVDLLEAGGEDDPIEVSLERAEAAIRGRLVDARGNPLPRAIVLARAEGRPHEQHRAEAFDGVFAFDALAEGPYMVRAIQDGHELIRRAAVQPGETLELRLSETLREVVLRVVDDQGNPQVGVRVDGGPFGRERSDERGRVRAQHVVPGVYLLRIRAPGTRGHAHEVFVPELPDDGSEPEIAVVLRP